MKNPFIAEYKFRPLKKQMQLAWKKIQTAIETDHFPEEKTMSEFLSFTNIMVSYPGFGDNGYDNFHTLSKSLYQYFKDDNFHAFKNTFFLIQEARKNCHNRYRYPDF